MTQENKSFIWKTFFILTGFISLLYWNSALNLNSFFSFNVNPTVFTYYNFAVSFGSLMAFLVGPIVFAQLSNYLSMMIAFLLSGFLFFINMYMVAADFDEGRKIWITTLQFTLVGFLISVLQGKGAGIAASISPKEIRYFNFGNGLCGMLTNLISFGTNMLYPFNMATDTKEKIIQANNNQALLYCIFIIVLIVIYFFVFFIFGRNYRSVLESDKEKEIERATDLQVLLNDDKEGLSDLKVIIRSFDLQFGIFFQYFVVLMSVAFFIIQSTLAYDAGDESRNKIFTIPFYLLFFNTGDTIGKFCPSHYQLKNVKFIYTLSFILVGVYAYFLAIMMQQYDTWFTSPYVRIVICLICGMLNGYNTNNYMSHAASRFKKSMDKAKAGYYCVLFLLMGIALANLVNTLYLTGN